MKVKMYFEGKEVCDIECDSYLTTNNGEEKEFKSIDLFLKNQIIGHFDSKYSFIIDNHIEIKPEINHTVLQNIISEGRVTVPYLQTHGGTSWTSKPNKIIKEYTS
jgi:hypothetical protein